MMVSLWLWTLLFCPRSISDTDICLKFVFLSKQEWIHAIEKVLGVGEGSVTLSDFDCLTLVGKGAYGK